jgi:hypothetical protein
VYGIKCLQQRGSVLCFKGGEELAEPCTTGRKRLILADKMGQAAKRPINSKILGLLRYDVAHSIELALHVLGLLQPEYTRNGNDTQRHYDIR